MKTLKNLVAATMLATAIFAAGCSETKKDLETGLTETMTPTEEDKRVEAARDSMEGVFLTTLNEIDRNLDAINSKHGIIASPASPEGTALPVREKIIRNLSMINTLMDENKEKLDKLNKQMKQYTSANAKLKKAAELTSKKMQEYELRISELKDQLGKQEFQYAELNKKMSELELRNQELQSLTEKLQGINEKFDKDYNTAYYTVGKYKELKKEGVVSRSGSFLGIGGAKTLKNDFPEDCFTKIDIRTVRSIPVEAKNAKLVTSHPTGSYEFKKETETERVASLEISDPEKFWKSSKYLVMEVR